MDKILAKIDLQAIMDASSSEIQALESKVFTFLAGIDMPFRPIEIGMKVRNGSLKTR